MADGGETTVERPESSVEGQKTELRKQELEENLRSSASSAEKNRLTVVARLWRGVTAP